MDRSPPTASFEQFAADRLNRDREIITREWVDRLSARLGVPPHLVLPREDLLNDIPPVLGKAAEFLIVPDEEKLTAERLVTEELREIAKLRRRQGYEPNEIIGEFDELAQVLDGAALHWIDEFDGTPEPKAVGRVFGRLNRAPLLMGEITIGVYREEETESRAAAARDLRAFTERLIHQLKTPLGAAEGAAMVLESDTITADAEERRRFAALIRHNLARARLVVDDVRALSFAPAAQAASGRFLPLSEVMREVLSEVGPLADERGVSIEVRQPVPELVVDASRVEIALLNLIANAIKYADPERDARWVRVSFSRPTESSPLWAEVADNGLGIPPDQHARIFEPFFRGHPDAAEGTGLGLALVREAVRQLGSVLDFESRPGTGTTFRFSIPEPGRREREG